MKAAAHETPYYIWRTAGDDKVRREHTANNGKIFAWDNPPPTGNHGDGINCRCWAELFQGVPPEQGLDSIYPELLFIPLLRIPSLIQAWRTWQLARRASKEWQLSKNKSDKKWANQIQQGQWTPQKISETIKRGTPYKAINKKTGSAATRYQLNDRFVVRDDATGDILQVSRPGMEPNIFE